MKIGDEFALRDGGSLYCKEDHDVLEKSTIPTLNSVEHNNNNNAMMNNNNNINSNTSISINNNHSSELGSISGM
jgi:insulin gene enhancer protein ISL-1